MVLLDANILLEQKENTHEFEVSQFNGHSWRYETLTMP